MTNDVHVLIVDDEVNMRKVLCVLLEQAGFIVSRAENGEQALRMVRLKDPDILLSDLSMPVMDGLELLEKMSASFPEIPVVMLTAHGSIATAVEAMKHGAFDFLEKPFDKKVVLSVLERASKQASKRRKEFQGPLSIDSPMGIIGKSDAIETVRKTIAKVAASPTTVLIEGETGTGKGLVADAIHRQSGRSSKPLVKINCAAIPAGLVESELFGHIRGAFTGAERDRRGRIELADSGTLFLDEIGDVPEAIQVKLLRVLQEKIIDPVGSSAPRKVDVRLVAATHRDLQKEVRAGRFREDLFFRLSVVKITVPPLRERLDDIEELSRFFIKKQSERLCCAPPSITEDALAALMTHAWPGNVRELENAIERALLLGDGSKIDARALGFENAEDVSAGRCLGKLKAASRAAASGVERRLIRAALEATSGNVTRAAEELGLSRRGLQMKMKELGIR